MNLVIRAKLITILGPSLVSKQIRGSGVIIRNAGVPVENKQMLNKRKRLESSH